MGTWDTSSFGNDTANDWAYELEKTSDLALIELTLDRIRLAGDECIEATDAEEVIAASEVLAWLMGRPGELNAYTEKIAAWVDTHPIQPSREIVDSAITVLDRIQRAPSELLDLWGGDPKWASACAADKNVRSS